MDNEKMWHDYTIEYYSSIKRHELQIYAAALKNLENTVLCDGGIHKKPCII